MQSKEDWHENPKLGADVGRFSCAVSGLSQGMEQEADWICTELLQIARARIDYHVR